MHTTMGVESRVRSWLDGKNADWTGGVARWRDGEARVLFCVPASVRASLVVDAHTVALLEGARATLVHEGDVTDVAFDAAQRLGVELLHVDDLPIPAPAPVADAPVEDLLAASLGALPPAEPVLAAVEPSLAVEALEAAVAAAGFPDPIEVPLAPLAVDPEALLAAPEPVLLLPAHAEPEPASLDYGIVRGVELRGWDFPEPILVPDAPLLGRLEDELSLAAALEAAFEAPSAPDVVVVAAPAPALEVVPALPWATPAPAEAAATLELPEEEVDAMPWSPHRHHEIMEGSPRRVDRIPHPTLAPQGPNWGLPWPRPVASADGLALHDPALWGARERVAAVRDDLAQKGSASFGAVKPEGSAWLKRIQHFGSP